jgi:hypothetical protein
MSLTDPQPTRQQSAYLYSGKRTQAGTLLLFPDRLVHVASTAMALGFLGGALGAVAVQQAAKKRAPGRAAAGGKGVVDIPFSQISGFGKGKQGLNRNVLEVHTIDGTTVKFGVKFDKWAPDLARFVPTNTLTAETTARQG